MPSSMLGLEADLVPMFCGAGYSGVYMQRTGSHQDGCAMFYKHSKLRLVEWLGLKYRRNAKVLNRDNVALLAKMELVQGDGYVVCCRCATIYPQYCDK